MWLDRAVKWLLPREEHFFDLLEKGADCAADTGTLLSQCVGAGSLAERETIVSRISDAEHAADDVIHEVYDALNRTFVTPFDRSDIFNLASSLEGIVDAINATCMQIVMHAMEDVPNGSVDLAGKVEKACGEIKAAVRLLRGLKRLDEIRAHCKAIYELEHDGDQVFRRSIVEIFKNERDAISLIKHKEFLEGLENTLDLCDNVANALDTLVIKNS